MTKTLVRANTRGCLKISAVFALVAMQCIAITTEIRGKAQSPPIVNFPSLAGKNMGDIIRQIKKQKKCREVTKELLARTLPGGPPFDVDDLCYFKIDPGILGVFTYHGRAVAFRYFFRQKAPTDPEEALRRVGIDVKGAKPQIQEDIISYYVWSGTFNEIKWKEVKVHQDHLKNRRCPIVFALLSDKPDTK